MRGRSDLGRAVHSEQMSDMKTWRESLNKIYLMHVIFEGSVVRRALDELLSRTE